MAEDDIDNPGAEATEESSGKMKKLLLIIIPILLLGVGGGLYFTGTLDSLLGKKPAVEGEEHAEGGHGDEKAAGEHGEGHAPGVAFLAVPDIIVNLQSDDNPHFIRLKIKLELKNEKDLQAVETVVPRVIDQFQTFLREMRLQDLRGTAGIYRLRQELLYRVNLAAKPVVVQDVLFQEILVQ